MLVAPSAKLGGARNRLSGDVDRVAGIGQAVFMFCTKLSVSG